MCNFSNLTGIMFITITKLINIMAAKKQKIYTYHKSAKFTDCSDNSEHSFLTQLYPACGVYGIFDGRSDMQGSYSPAQIEKQEKLWLKLVSENVIKDLEFGFEIKVTKDLNGYWCEV